GGKGFAPYDDVRLQAEFAVSKETPRAAQSALDFIADQQRPMSTAKFCGGFQEVSLDFHHAAFALNYFHHNRRDVGSEVFEQVRHVVQVNEADSWRQGLKRLTIF